jgi:hypothetical protein
MKVVFKESIKTKVDKAIERYGDTVDSIELTRDEYIAFIEELDFTNRAVLSLPERQYKKVQIVIVP